MLSSEAAVGATFLNITQSLWLPWTHLSLPFPVSSLQPPSSVFNFASAQLTLFSFCQPHAFHPSLQISASTTSQQAQPSPLLQAAEPGSRTPGHLSLNLPRSRCNELGWQSHPSSDGPCVLCHLAMYSC